MRFIFGKNKYFQFLLIFTLGALLVFLGYFSFVFHQYHPMSTYYKSDKKNIPILIFHGVENNSSNEYDISLRTLIKQMEYLREKKYQVISIADYLSFLNGEKTIPRNSVLITFHDNHAGWYEHVYPYFRENNIPASFCIVAKTVPNHQKGKHIGFQELREMALWRNKQGKRLFTVESHSMTHERLGKNRNETQESYLARIRYELIESKIIIEDAIGISPLIVSLPYGDGWDNAEDKTFLWDVSIKAGYQGLQAGSYHTEGAFGLGGMSIHNTRFSMLEFKLALSIFTHKACFQDFLIWLGIVFERAAFNITHKI